MIQVRTMWAAGRRSRHWTIGAGLAAGRARVVARFALVAFAFPVLLLAAAPAVQAQTAAQAASGDTAAPRKNWYNDPFFALSDAVAACPLPLGPFMTRAEADDDAHYRVERGTTCWLAHKCTKPNSYLYDADIAAAIRQQLQGAPMLAGTSLWITVQRRFVYAEGCVGAGFDREALERRLAAIPDVEQVFVRVSSDPRGTLPYKTLARPD
ncbi:BON domain-containing protein [Paraburkholderia ferrariae]|uniref:BON domain-containing protein n=1 Tax=Paraburkholderia ferrariae TaxID=386056 RepID=UPI000A7987B1|nr:BON domain-containing protein [Paraburkholderia ferrariae]